ncbi:amidohydrolase [Actibacterium mucosum KCTC 23349]|uniref:Amidohydrolase n=1 Tax=Actibacterium mucosum KCTC 23349 TaxID=1454373 RepID=A0A037ZP04_9RHOB|nr:carbon-nitrogen hydrolase family protein [Actibacterium mucosum]KAJ57283.1 amidohydrolase [Actibacterium mucosum KCTC 23349]
MRVAALQITSSDDPAENLETVRHMMRRAVDDGAQVIATPEVTNCLSASRDHQRAVLQREGDDPTLAGLRDTAAALGVHLLIGSLALATDDADGRFANRSFLIGPDGAIVARYDKIHMFDVDLNGSQIRESDGYRPGDRAVLADTALGRLGLTICYDLRFPHLFRDLARAGAQVIFVPSAFHPVTGAAHWHVLLRARAIETGAFIVAPAQTGTHAARAGKARTSYGHSLIISPWGEILGDQGTEPGILSLDLKLAEVETSRRRIPALLHDRDYESPN